jgi:hypothetical protein
MKTATSWKRVLALGCSHGIYADPDAIAAVLKFKASFRPDYTIHLGDAIDCTAFMSSTVRDGSGDPIEPDVDGGLRFLRQLRPTHFLLGNHEHRLHRLIHSKHELVRFAAAQVLDGITDECRALKCKMIPYTGNSQELVIGNVRFMHGTVYSENATRDHAESYAPWKGSVVHAHTHRAGMATGRRADSPLGFSVGTLTQRDALEYAKTRRATLSWSQAFVWGYVSHKSSQLFLCQKQAKEWRLP